MSVPCDSLATESGSEEEDPAPRSKVDRAPQELVVADCPLFGTNFKGLTNSVAAWRRQQCLDFYFDNTQLSMEAKLTRFQRFCEDHDLQVFPTHPSSVYWYVCYLHEDGQISVHSLMQDLAQYRWCINLVHI